MGPPSEETHLRCGGLGPSLGPGLLLSSGENPTVLNANWPGEGQSGSWPREGQGLLKAKRQNEMQNSIQANTHSFCMGGFWEIRGASQSKGFLLLLPSQSPLGSRIDMLYRTAQ